MTPVAAPTAPTRRTLLRWLALASLATPMLTHLDAAAAEGPGAPPEVAQALPKAQVLGAGRMRYLLWDVFDATLWTPPDFRGAQYAEHAFALELRYLRPISAASLVESSLKEMRRTSSIDAAKETAWTQAMQTAFADVQAGDRITGVHRPGAGTRFFFNGRLRGVVEDAAFARAFFGIWLGAGTSEPRLRSALLAGSTS